MAATPCIPAAHHGHPEVVRELLKTTIAVNHVNRLGWTALLETIILSDGGPVASGHHWPSSSPPART